MTRIGSALASVLVLTLATAAWAAGAAEDLEFYQTVDRTEVGSEETIRLTVVVGNAPDDSRVQLPETDDFEILSRSQSTEMAYHMGGGGPGTIKRVTKWVVVLRPTKLGTLTIPASTLVTPGRNYRADALKVTVKKGRTQQAQPQRDPLSQLFPLLQEPDADEEDPDDPQVSIPRSDSDLFLRAYVDNQDVFVGEQLTYSVFVYSRVDISSVDSLKMPKLEGFWSEELESPNQLVGDQKIINGVPYRAYLLWRRAIFPVKPGKVTIDAAEADVTTGFLFANRRVHRKSNGLDVTVKPLPAAGKPPGFLAPNVGQWRLGTEVSQTRIDLGQPLTVRMILEGRGNLRNVAMPKLQAPAGLRVYDPTTTDKVQTNKAKLGGRRVQEYLVMPSQTGTFTLPALRFPYFDPVLERYEVSETDPITITVEGAGASAQVSSQPGVPDETAAKNVLAAGGLKPPRVQARFEGESTPVWRRAFFVPAIAAAPLLFLAVVLGGALRQRLGRHDPEADRRRRAKAARLRLSAAEKLRASGKPDAFYGEVEKAVVTFLEAKLAAPVAGLTRSGLDLQMASRGVSPERRQQILEVLEQCDAGRYSPSGGEAVRARILDDAAAAMEGWR